MMVRMLLAHGANPDIKGSIEGDTPLHYAVRFVDFTIFPDLSSFPP